MYILLCCGGYICVYDKHQASPLSIYVYFSFIHSFVHVGHISHLQNCWLLHKRISINKIIYCVWKWKLSLSLSLFCLNLLEMRTTIRFYNITNVHLIILIVMVIKNDLNIFFLFSILTDWSKSRISEKGTSKGRKICFFLYIKLNYFQNIKKEKKKKRDENKGSLSVSVLKYAFKKIMKNDFLLKSKKKKKALVRYKMRLFL